MLYRANSFCFYHPNVRCHGCRSVTNVHFYSFRWHSTIFVSMVFEQCSSSRCNRLKLDVYTNFPRLIRSLFERYRQRWCNRQIQHNLSHCQPNINCLNKPSRRRHGSWSMCNISVNGFRWNPALHLPVVP